MFQLLRTESQNPDFLALVNLLDKELALRDGQEHSFYAPLNSLDSIRHAVVAFNSGIPAGCGAMKSYDSRTMEIKRMFCLPVFRGKGLATRVLNELEVWAVEIGYGRFILETGKKQPEAIHLYLRNDYRQIPNYGPYAGVLNSLCFEKIPPYPGSGEPTN